KTRVESFGQQGIFSKELATIMLEVPVPFVEEELVLTEPNEPALTEIFEELEFRTIAKRAFKKIEKEEKPKKETSQMGLFDGGGPSAEESAPSSTFETIDTIKHTYTLVDTEEGRKQLIKLMNASPSFCFDTETTSLETVDAEIVGLAVSLKTGTAYYVPFGADQTQTAIELKEFQALLEDPEKLKIGQNLKYDIQILRNYDISVKGPLFDTMLAHYLIDPETAHSMDRMAENYLNYSPVSISTLIGPKGKNQKSIRDAEIKEVCEYACEDADITLQLKEKLEPQIKELGLEKLLHEVEEPLSFVLSDMEYTGVSIDKEALAKMSVELEEASRIAQDEIFKTAGMEFNIGSPKQLGEVLFDKLKLVDKPKKTKSGQYATGEDILSKLAAEHDIANKILEFREYQKLKSTYVDALPRLISPTDGRVHTDYRQTVAVTGRLSSNNPNLQNIPIRTIKGREIRKAFVPQQKEHLLMAADYSQVELRIMAAFSGDQSMQEAFRAGRDIHANTASKVFKVPLAEVDGGMRRKAKEVNFGIIYGISAFGLSQNLNIPRGEASEIIRAYFEEFPSVKSYMDSTIETARENEYVETILGRRRYLRNINSKNFTMRGFDERNAINAPIQGSAADIIKVAMINIHDWMKTEKLKSKMIMQVHDELVFEVPKDELALLQEKVQEMMQHAVSLDVPLEVEVGTGANWLEAH
ncbi:MAG: DNA polymerase-1, partial [Cyclobacteriaceae bacterium]